MARTWTIISTGEGAAPAAELELDGETVRVTDPERLAAAAERLLETDAAE